MQSSVAVEFLGHQVVVSADDERVIRRVASNFEAMRPVGGPAPSQEVLEFRRRGNVYELLREGMPISSAPEKSEAQRMLRHEIIQSFVRVHPHLLWLHAGAAILHGRAVLFVGSYGRGKSTLVTHLCARGWRYASDDIVPVDLVTHRILPFLLTPVVRQDIGRQLPRERLTELQKMKISLPASAHHRESASIGAIVLPTYRSGAAASFKPYSPSTVALDIIREGINCGRHGETTVKLCARLINEVPVLPLVFSDAHAAADLVEQSLTSALAG